MKRKSGHRKRHRIHTHRAVMEGYSEKAICKPTTEISGETCPTVALILDFWPPEG